MLSNLFDKLCSKRPFDPILCLRHITEPIDVNILPFGARKCALRAYFRFFGGCNRRRYSSPVVKSGGYTIPSPHITSPSLLLIQILCHGLRNIAIPHGCPRAEPGSAFPYRYCTISGRYSLFSDRRMRQRSCHPFSFQRLDIALCSVSAALLSRVPSLVNPRLGTTCHELIVPCAAWLLSPSYCLCSSLYSIAALLSRPHDFL